MALILSIETASPVCSVALIRDGMVVSLRESGDDRPHATKLTVFIREMLDETGIAATSLDAISLGMGPGSYTGLRIGASVAKGLAYGAAIPVIGIPTLKALASGFLATCGQDMPEHDSPQPPLLCPMLDARRLEVYTALYDLQLNEVRAVEALVLEPDSFSSLLDDRIVHFFGTGSDKAADIIVHPNARFHGGIELSAAWQAEPAELLFQAREFLDTAYFEPHYLKEFIASIPKNKVLG
jgi:tRNA threonylcarbamoyladenosine biosynthesis protein TsaB